MIEAREQNSSYWVFPIGASFKNNDTSFRNTKPNEDSYVIDRKNGIFMVCDGVTRSALNKAYPDPSPAKMASALFSIEAHKALREVIHISEPKQALSYAAQVGNEAVAELNKRLFAHWKVDYDILDLAGACGILGFIRDNHFHYAFNGDCSGTLVGHDGSRTRFTRSQTAAIMAWCSSVPLEQRGKPYLRQHLRNNPDHPAAYGVFTGEPAALDPRLLEFGVIALEGGERIILNSDGFDALFESEQEVDFGLPNLAKQATARIEQGRNLRSDDKTMIDLEIFQIHERVKG